MNEFEILPLGSITLFVNTHRLREEYPSAAFREAIAEALIDHLRQRLEDIPGSEQLVVTQVRTTVGCIIITISLGTLLTGIATRSLLKGTYNFVKDYDKLIGNSQRIATDLKNIYVKITRKKVSQSPIPQIEVLTEVPPDLAIAETSGVVSTGGEEIRIAKVAVMRDDLLRCLEIENTRIKIELHQQYNKHLDLNSSVTEDH